MKRLRIWGLFFCFFLCLPTISLASSVNGWFSYQIGGISLDVPLGSKIIKTTHLTPQEISLNHADEFSGFDEALLRAPDGTVIFINVMNTTTKYFSSDMTEESLPLNIKEDTLISTLNSHGQYAQTNVFNKQEIRIYKSPAYMVAGKKVMFNQPTTMLSYLFMKDNKMVVILYSFSNQGTDGNTTDDQNNVIGENINTSLKGFSFE